MIDLSDFVLFAATAGLTSASAYLLARLRDAETKASEERRERMALEEARAIERIKRENAENDIESKMEALRHEAAESRRAADDAKRVAEIV